MNDSRTMTVWMCLGLLVVVGVFLLFFGQMDRWTNWQKSRFGVTGDGPAKPPALITGGTADETNEPIEPTLMSLRAAQEALANRLLEALRGRVQSIGAMENEALLTFKSQEALMAFLKRSGGAGLRVLGQLDALRTVRVGYDSLERLRSELLNHGDDYADVGANYLVRVPGLPPAENRVGGDSPFGETVMTALGANVDRSQWGNGVVVAVVDTGVVDHPAFRERQIRHVDLVKDGQVFDGHGTAMASLIAGSKPGAEGLAQAAQLLDVRVADANGESDSFMLASGITTAVNEGAHIINISLVSYGDAPVVRSAVREAHERGVVIFAAVGNEQAGIKGLPADIPGVVSVSGVDADGELAYFSNSGDPTIAAPAVSIPSAYFEDGRNFYVLGDGTSQASALAAGMGAVYRGWGFNVREAITSRARPVNASPHEVGAGVLFLGPK
ncbi:MAG: S8 family peptidase [Verrucomicrobiales bacterium]